MRHFHVPSNSVLLVPVLAVFSGLVSQYTSFDVWLASLFYDSVHHVWPYKNAWLTETVIHTGGRKIVVSIGLSLLVYFFLTLIIPALKAWRRRAGFLLVASLSSVLIIGVLKANTHIQSPWDLTQFGGIYPHLLLFDSVPAGVPTGYAFPGGHAGGGFSLLSFYFLFRYMRHPAKNVALLVALVTGFAFGIAQDIRGAHMLSHELFSLAICWTCCIIWEMFLLERHASLVAVGDLSLLKTTTADLMNSVNYASGNKK